MTKITNKNCEGMCVAGTCSKEYTEYYEVKGYAPFDFYVPLCEEHANIWENAGIEEL